MVNEQREQDQHLLAALDGDRDALARLLMLESHRLSKRIADRMKLNPFADFSADDVLQEVFVDVFRGIKTFRREDASGFHAWLNKIADNRLASMYRERSRKKRGGEMRRAKNLDRDFTNSAVQLVALLADDDASASRAAKQDEVVHALQVGIAALPADQREAVRQYYIDQKSLDSTAEAMGKTDNAVRGLLQRAKKSLRTVLGNSTAWFSRR